MISVPLVRISVLDDTPPETRRAIGDAVHAALVEVAGVPPDERFQIVDTRPADNLMFDRAFGGVDRRSVVLVEITMVRTLTVNLKRQLFQRITHHLVELAGVRSDDVFTVLTENGLADWSQSGGELTLMPR